MGRKKFAKTYFGVLAGVLMVAALSFGTYSAGLNAGKMLERNAAISQDNNSYINSENNNLEYTFTNSSYLNTSTEVASEGFAGVYKAVKDSVVSINTKSVSSSVTLYGFSTGPQEVSGAGSGIIFYEDDEKVYIVTNFHVVASATSATISLDDETHIDANYIGGDESADIAVISVNKSELSETGIYYKAAVFGNSDLMEIGHLVIAVGNALGEGKTATDGIISAKDRLVSIDGIDFNLLQTSAAINRGNSGGALVNVNGEVIGINSIKLIDTSVEAFGYAIPSNKVIEIIDKIMIDGSVQPPVLGIRGATITEEDKELNNLPAIGVYVSSVISGNTTAKEIGLEAGDIIIKFSGVEITSFEQLKELIDATPVGEDIAVTVVRGVYRTTGFGGRYAVDSETIVLEGKMKSGTEHPEF